MGLLAVAPWTHLMQQVLEADKGQADEDQADEDPMLHVFSRGRPGISSEGWA